MRQLYNRPAEKWAFLPSNKPNKKLGVFIHGFRGDYITTWGIIPEYLARNADADKVLNEWDYLFIGYKTSNVESYIDLALLLSSQIKLAAKKQSPFLQKYEKFALFGHSLGTLGIRQLLCAWAIQPKGFITQLRSITLFGTPLNGSPWAPVGSIFYGIAEALKSGNPQLRMLKLWSDGAYASKPWPPVNIVLGLDDKVVGARFSELMSWPGDKNVHTTNLDHGQLVKPESFQGSTVINMLQNALK